MRITQKLTILVLLFLLALLIVPGASAQDDEEESSQVSETTARPLEGDTLDFWQDPTGEWRIVGEAMLDSSNEERLASEPGTGVILNGEEGNEPHLISTMQHGDIEAHIEFMVPENSNSGVYFMGRYEIQILDSYGKKDVGSGDCGGIYERWRTEEGLDDDERGYEGVPPRVNASRPPGEWQSYDIVFHAPRFDKEGNKISNAKFVSVEHNGKLIHENEEVGGPTRSPLFETEEPVGPIMFQGDHGPVAYRNIRLRYLNERLEAADPCDALLSYTYGYSRQPLMAIENRIRNDSSRDFKEIEAKLLEVLKAPKATYAGKEFACRMLYRAGSEASIPVLADLLKDERLSHMARYALQEIALKDVDNALLAALESDEIGDSVKIGLISSIGRRDDRKSIRQLESLAGNSNENLAGAAIAALGSIGSEGSAKALRNLQPGGSLKDEHAIALIECADRLQMQNENKLAKSIYNDLTAEDTPISARVAAYRGVMLIDPAQGRRMALDLLNNDDKMLRQAAINAIPHIPGDAFTKDLAAALPSLSGDAKIMLIAALSERGSDLARPAVEQAAAEGSEDVKLAAMDALVSLGGLSSLDVLLEAASGRDDVADAALRALSRLQGDGIDAALVDIASGSDDIDARVGAIQGLAARQYTDAMPLLYEAAGSDVRQVQRAAYQAIGDLAQQPDMFRLVSMLIEEESSSSRRALQRVLSSITSRIDDADYAAEPIVEGLREAEAARENLLAVLANIGGSDAFRAVLRQLDAESSEARRAAIRALGDWPDPAPMAILLALAQTEEDQALRTLSLYGYLNMLSRQRGLPDTISFQLIKEAVPLIERMEEKQRILGMLSRIEKPEALQLASAYLDDKAVQAEAESAVQQISAAIGKTIPVYSSVELPASAAEIHGSGAEYSGRGEERRSIMNWTDEETWISWEIDIKSPGEYEVSLRQAMVEPKGNRFSVQIGRHQLEGQPQETESMYDFEMVSVGTVEIEDTGPAMVIVKPLKKETEHFMILRSVRLQKVD